MNKSIITSSNFLYKKFKHDLKNPINAMIGYSEYIIEEIDSDNYIVHINDINSIFKTSKNIHNKIESSFNDINIEGYSIDMDEFQFDLRSSLCSVIGIIEIIKDNSDLDVLADSRSEEFNDCIANIYKSCKTLLEIVENIKIYIKQDDKKTEKKGLPSLPNNDYKSYRNKISTVKYSGNILIIDDDVLNTELMI